MAKKAGSLLIILGSLLLLFSASFVFKVWLDEYHAARAVKATLYQTCLSWNFPCKDLSLSKTAMSKVPTDKDSFSPAKKDVTYLLLIPSLDLSLPVQSNWNDSLLEDSPCRYQGSLTERNMIIAGHNYQAHFGSLKYLHKKDSLSLLTSEGKKYLYTVSDIEILNGKDLEKMEEGDWDLTLFTCTWQGQKRLTVRCRLQE